MLYFYHMILYENIMIFFMHNSFYVPAFIVLAISLLVSAFAMWTWVRWYRPLSSAITHKVSRYAVSWVETSLGRAAYARREGSYPVLVLHGPGDGCRYGLARAEKHLDRACMIIVPSRPGYDGTLHPGEAHSYDADFYAVFLEALHIERAAVLAYSIAYPAAASFACKYPHKVSAVMLISPAEDMHSSLCLRMLVRLHIPFVYKIMRRMYAGNAHAMSHESQHELDVHLVNCIKHRKGYLRDLTLHAYAGNALENLRSANHPKLIMYAKGDSLVSVSVLQEEAEMHRQTKIVPVMQGGHLLLGAGEIVRTETDMFLHIHGGTGETAEPAKRRKGIRTKQALLAEAISLFAETGYDGASLRELAARVGIKESSIYNHYTSKDEILEAIFTFYALRMREMRPSLQEIGEASSYLSAEEILAHIILKEADRTDADLEKASLIILREKYTNVRAREIYLEVAVDETVKFFAEVFCHLQNRGKMATGDPMQYARQYRAVLADIHEEHTLKAQSPASECSVKGLMIEHARTFARLMQPKDS